MKHTQLLIGGALALSSVWALAQDAPESLLPPGFDKPAFKSGSGRSAAPAPKPAPAARTEPAAKAATAPKPAAVTAEPASSPDTAVVQSIVQSGSGTSSAETSGSATAKPARIPTIEELEKLAPEELEEALGIKPQFTMVAATRRSLNHIGVLGAGEGGLPSGSLGGQSATLIRAALAGNKGALVSRWGHILLRRALVSRLDSPETMKPAEFAALRAALLVRMGEGEAARALVQDIDPGNYSPELSQAAFDSYLATADLTGICPVVTAQSDKKDDEQWQVLRSICSAFRGEGNTALSQIERQAKSASTLQPIDYLLAQKYAGAAGKARRAVKIEWDGVKGMSPLRYALTIGVGLVPSEALMKNSGLQYHYVAASAPMLGLGQRADAADFAGGAGILSSAAMVDTYSQIYADQDITGDWAARANLLHDAYAAGDAASRLAAMKKLWDSAGGPQQRYARQVLTAYAAARLPAESGLSGDAGDLIASMLAAGLDANAMRWSSLAKVGSPEWAMLALATPTPSVAVEVGDLKSFYSNDNSADARRSAFLLAGLAGLERVTPDTIKDFSDKLGIDLKRQTGWTRLIDQSADVGNPALVALLAGLGMQGNSWEKMTPVYLYHIVSALRRTGFEAEARMIAAEAIARS